jgi:hypothetical protein
LCRLADAVCLLRARALLTRPKKVVPRYELTPKQLVLDWAEDWVRPKKRSTRKPQKPAIIACHKNEFSNTLYQPDSPAEHGTTHGVRPILHRSSAASCRPAARGTARIPQPRDAIPTSMRPFSNTEGNEDNEEEATSNTFLLRPVRRPVRE